ncbi:glycyl-radical enzyme activating protein [Anaerotruncus rubiinfantis]|uniref:glycyl-radical enzyme activating protein n=1 Tax=Anaerotruncus rubiinfantis TaxID=1720200 RepID=UPI0018997640|nr:glycyl-radical enzyme activating protein [Anaerotruncus rubiinfantis]
MERCDLCPPTDSRGLIFDLYRGTTHDGPGLRSTVFFKGCPLSCAWCHNPEGIPFKRAVWWDGRTCIGCGLCHEACPYGANEMKEQGIVIDREKCRACGACVKACPAQAMTFIGEDWELEKLVRELLKDKTYYDQTGGGVTASGGEALMQADFVAALFVRLHEAGVTTALDTCGLAGWDALEKVLPHTDYVLYDLKILDGAAHKQFTGADNAAILEHAKRIAQGIADGVWNAQMWIRTPLIPGATATEENLSEIGRFIAGHLLPAVTRWELCAFNNSCINKYEKLGGEWSYSDVKLIGSAQAEKLREAALLGGCSPEMVFVTGLVAE